MNEEEYTFRKRKELLEKAVQSSRGGHAEDAPLLLSALTTIMREAAAEDSSFASLYFAGARGDHPYFLLSDKLAVGISVLPEDAEKAGRAKSHPHQRELIIVLQGRVALETAADGSMVRRRVLQEGESALIEPGECHRVTPVGSEESAYAFIKTMPAAEPREEDCEL